MPEIAPNGTPALRCQRLQEFLEQRAREGLSQQQVAHQMGIPAQYLSDVKVGRRQMTELFARRLADEFGINHRWLLGESDRVDLACPPPTCKNLESSRSMLVPVLSGPVQGEPRDSSDWDGSLVELTGAAAAAAARGFRSYILRLPADDHAGRLAVGDLVLISQGDATDAHILVVKSSQGLHLCRRSGHGVCLDLATGREITGERAVVGWCIGIVWGALQ